MNLQKSKDEKQNNYQNVKQKNHKNSYQTEFQKLANVKIAITWKQHTSEAMNNAWNFHFLWIDVVIQVACLVCWTSIFTRQMIVVADFFIYWLECFGTDLAVRGAAVFLYSLLCSRDSCFIRVLLTRCCLQTVVVARTWSKQFSAASSVIFTWGVSKDCPSLHFTLMQLLHDT